MARINIGIVGCGRILNAHLKGYKTLRDAGFDNFRITALCSRDRDNALRFRKRGEGPPPFTPLGRGEGDPLACEPMYVSDVNDDVAVSVYTDYREMLDRGDIHVVDVCAALPAHHEIALLALKAGKHVVVEKPIALTVRMARTMTGAAEDMGLVLCVAESARYGMALRAQKWAVDAGLIGDLQMVLMGGVGMGRWSPDRVLANTPWRHDKIQGGAGVSIDLGVHMFNRAEYVAGLIDSLSAVTAVFEPKRKLYDDDGEQSVGEIACTVDDAFMAVGRFANGAIGQFSYTSAGHGPGYQVPGGMIVYGSKGCMREGRMIMDDGTSHNIQDRFKAEAPETLVRKYFPRGVEYPFALEKLDFLQAIEENRDPEMHGLQGLRDLAVAYTVLESAAAGRMVRVQEVESGEVEKYQREINEHYGF
ncbi:MAG: Gfo/Idh/MocA family oxidoreductase [Planctomycetota bacterium]